MAAAVSCFNICTADLNRKCSINIRIVQAPAIGETTATEEFTQVGVQWFNVKTLRSGGAAIQGKGTARFSGVVITPNATHVFTCRYRQFLKDLDSSGEYFLKLVDKYYRVNEITDLNENHHWLLFQCSERGLVAKEASHA